MENSSQIVSFVLTAYGNIGELKYLYFSIILLWYLSICVANTLLIVVIHVDRRLHEPMYILLCNLCVNEIKFSTSLYPLLLSQMFSDSHEVTLPWCFLQICCLYTSAPAEFCSLAAMAYDRYIAICHPLHYNVLMNTERVFVMILLVWIYSFVSFILSFSFIFSLKFCANNIDNVYCDHQLLIKLSCSVSVHSNILEIFFAIVSIFIPFSLISLSYMKILKACRKTSKENKQKAVTTCTPQIVSVSNLFVGCIFSFINFRLLVAHVPDEVHVILPMYLLICQPILTPFMYGFHLPKIRQSCERFLFNRNS
ncbi:putative gustatory receptor clone PTE01 [Archocentrus centrarchus]|uniref:putative gustatory receptor clone PTE01 n=1 Tax=Archocentrus centrarchus TaxID=63155 RepID=UPI0011E9F82F|nr:putative gustatory receptor clone PTE01 [Archocentrus centrarchus]